MRNIKLLFFLAVWKRPEITEICFMGLNRMRRSRLMPMEFFAVISEPSMIPLCEKYGVEWCMHENLPLGAKKNYGLGQAMKKDFDYMIEIGSDDLLKNEFLDLYPFEHCIYSLRDFLVINTVNGECRRLTDRHAAFGVGRAISKKTLEALNSSGMYGLWADKYNHGLDNQSTFFLARKGFMERRISSLKPLAIDLKSAVNIWPFEKKGFEHSFDEAMEGLSIEEVNAIKSLQHVEV